LVFQAFLPLPANDRHSAKAAPLKTLAFKFLKSLLRVDILLFAALAPSGSMADAPWWSP